MKKILLVDDSALMRRVFCDIIESDGRFAVADQAYNGAEAVKLLQQNTYDVVLLDVYMPKLDGLGTLRELNKLGIKAKIVLTSSVERDGTQVVLDAMSLGAIEFIEKPQWAYKCKDADFQATLFRVLEAACQAKIVEIKTKETKTLPSPSRPISDKRRTLTTSGGSKIVALACSTGGPRALQCIIPELAPNLDAPVVVVQHMPPGMTLSLAQRMDHLSKIRVVEAEEGEVLETGCVYVARSGYHLNLVPKGKDTVVHYSEEPHREGVRPCANYMYESLVNCHYDDILCVVLTGMGADGTEGIKTLKKAKDIQVITQDEESCVVYGMPKSVVKAGLSDKEVTLNNIAKEIILHMGVN